MMNQAVFYSFKVVIIFLDCFHKMLPPMPSKRINARMAPTQPLQNILNRDQRLIKINSKALSRQSINISNDQQQQTVKHIRGRSASRDKQRVPRCQSSRQISIQRSISGERPSSKRSRKSSQGSIKIINIAASDIASLPYVTAKSWMVYEINSDTPIYSKKRQLKREVASLTKIANLITILDLLAENKLDPKIISLKVTKEAASMIGTTAELRQNMVFKLYDLFFGMMLPSGNDAAFLIAQFGGTLISLIRANERGGLNNLTEQLECVVYDQKVLQERMRKFNSSSVSTYLNKMNNICKLKVKTQNTSFANPHGLSNVNSLSTAEDMARISSYGMKNKTFREVVLTKNYSCKYTLLRASSREPEVQNNDENQDPLVSNVRQEQVEWKEDILNMAWVNTNKMLWRGWSGVKTGITPNAGPCLSASVQREIDGKKYEFLVILLKSYSMDARWKEVEGLVEWASGLIKKKAVLLN